MKKDLSWFLLKEALLIEDEKNSTSWEELPDFEGRGRNSNELKDFLELTGAVLDISKSKKNTKLKINDNEGRNQILSDLNIKGAPNSMEDLLSKVFNGNNTLMSALTRGNVESVSNNVYMLPMSPNFKGVMGTLNSSIKYLRFWLQNILVAVNFAQQSNVGSALEIKIDQKKNNIYIKFNR